MKQRQCLPSSVKYNIFTKLKQAKKKKKVQGNYLQLRKIFGHISKKMTKQNYKFFMERKFFFFKKTIHKNCCLYLRVTLFRIITIK